MKIEVTRSMTVNTFSAPDTRTAWRKFLDWTRRVKPVENKTTSVACFTEVRPRIGSSLIAGQGFTTLTEYMIRVTDLFDGGFIAVVDGFVNDEDLKALHKLRRCLVVGEAYKEGTN